MKEDEYPEVPYFTFDDVRIMYVTLLAYKSKAKKESKTASAKLSDVTDKVKEWLDYKNMDLDC